MSMGDRARKKAERRKSGDWGRAVDIPEGTDKLKLGKVVSFDIIPYRVSIKNHPEGVEKGDTWFQRTFFIHKDVGPNNKTYLCPKTVGKPCPICEEHAKLRKDPDADDETLKKLRQKERELFNVIDTSDRKKGVQILDISVHLFGKLLEEELNADEDSKCFADLS